MNELTDQQLISNYLAGDESSFAALVNRHLELVVNFANTFVKNRSVAEDMAQAAFVKVWKNLKKYDSGSSFKTWLLVITKNTCLDYLRKQKIEQSNLLSLDDGDSHEILALASEESLPDEMFFKQELKNMLNDVLAGFSEADKLIVVLHYYEQLTFEEIAEVLSESVNTVKSRHRRLLIKLRSKLQ